jgi:hypothetical protein
MPDASSPSPVRSAPPRRPAPPDFLARHVAAIAWWGPAPAPGALRRTLETCRAELAWSRADWSFRHGHDDARHVEPYDGPHPEEAHRLPHERAAARVLGAWNHVVVWRGEIHKLLARLRAQIAAGWSEPAEATRRDLRLLHRRRRIAWRATLAAVAEYRTLR